MARSQFPELKYHSPSTKEVLLSLEAEYQWLNLLPEKPYKILFDMIKSEALDESYSRGKSIKEIAENVNQKTATVTKWINQIYTDIWELNESEPELFRTEGHKYYLSFQDSNTKQSRGLTLWTTANFKVNDRFNWYFLRGLLGVDYFYIQEIVHGVDRGEIITNVYLKSGLPNDYRNHLINKGLFLNLIDFIDIQKLPGFMLDDILRETIQKDRPYFEPEEPRKRFRRGFD